MPKGWSSAARNAPMLDAPKTSVPRDMSSSSSLCQGAGQESNRPSIRQSRAGGRSSSARMSPAAAGGSHSNGPSGRLPGGSEGPAKTGMVPPSHGDRPKAATGASKLMAAAPAGAGGSSRARRRRPGRRTVLPADRARRRRSGHSRPVPALRQSPPSPAGPGAISSQATPCIPAGSGRPNVTRIALIAVRHIARRHQIVATTRNQGDADLERLGQRLEQGDFGDGMTTPALDGAIALALLAEIVELAGKDRRPGERGNAIEAHADRFGPQTLAPQIEPGKGHAFEVERRLHSLEQAADLPFRHRVALDEFLERNAKRLVARGAGGDAIAGAVEQATGRRGSGPGRQSRTEDGRIRPKGDPRRSPISACRRPAADGGGRRQSRRGLAPAVAPAVRRSDSAGRPPRTSRRRGSPRPRAGRRPGHPHRLHPCPDGR